MKSRKGNLLKKPLEGKYNIITSRAAPVWVEGVVLIKYDSGKVLFRPHDPRLTHKVIKEEKVIYKGAENEQT